MNQLFGVGTITIALQPRVWVMDYHSNVKQINAHSTHFSDEPELKWKYSGAVTIF